MSLLVKICGITSQNDAMLAAEAGASAIGFNFYPQSPRYLSFDSAHRIACILPDSVLKVGVFVEPSEDDLKLAIDQVPLDVIQLHGRHVPSIAHRTWRALSAEHANPSESLVAEAILLDAHTPHYGGSGQTFDWKIAARFWQPIILAGGLDASNVAEAIAAARPWGVDACSRLESSPGVKDPVKLRSFVEAAHAAIPTDSEPRPAASGLHDSLPARSQQVLS
ncbi:MAG: phosphoribosylanthranilate isomerase [Acidobacteriaceae bacterium]|nr:phosphoribosylanthranilate isomerase [Acidobacteriaceae bacterium]